eukprot:10935298-Ditylum_brightwellii.AAC.1
MLIRLLRREESLEQVKIEQVKEQMPAGLKMLVWLLRREELFERVEMEQVGFERVGFMRVGFEQVKQSVWIPAFLSEINAGDFLNNLNREQRPAGLK